MKLFVPNKLIHIVEKIEQEHPLTAPELPEITQQALYELIQRINHADDEELIALSGILTKREIQALCRYLEHDAYHAELQKIAIVINERFDKACFSILFRVWQNVPNQLYILSLLADHDKSKYRPDDLSIKEGVITGWEKARLPLLAVVRTCQDASVSAIFAENYVSVGLSAETPLYYQSYAKFLYKSSIQQFILEGDLHLAEILQHLERADIEGIILELLRCAEKYKKQLMQFREVYRHAYKLWGEPNRVSFPGNREHEYWVYKYWYDATQLSQILGHDPRREKFWSQFLGLENVQWSVVNKHDMLVMTFGDKVVTEFMEVGPVYIYDKNYYEQDVKYQINRQKTPSLKSWMKNQSDYLSREVHHTRWEYNQRYALRKVGIIE